jgi:hypothetical protein
MLDGEYHAYMLSKGIFDRCPLRCLATGLRILLVMLSLRTLSAQVIDFGLFPARQSLKNRMWSRRLELPHIQKYQSEMHEH